MGLTGLPQLLWLCVYAGSLAEQGIYQLVEPFLLLNGASLDAPPVDSMGSKCIQRRVLPGLATVAAAITALLTSSVQRAGKAYLLQQSEALLLAASLLGCTGPLVAQLLQASVNLFLQNGHYPAKHKHKLQDGSWSLALLMEHIQWLLSTPNVLTADTPASTVDHLQASLVWWATGDKEAVGPASKLILHVSGFF
jgi:hypothetical protein